jgi:hypothetical protein
MSRAALNPSLARDAQRAESSPDRVAAATARMGGAFTQVVRGTGSLKLVDTALFAALAVAGMPGLPGIPGGLDNVVVAIIVAVALVRRPTATMGRWQMLIPLAVLALAYVGFVSLFAESSSHAAEWHLRLLRMAVVLALLFVMVSGRVDIRSAVGGYAAAALVNVPLFFAGLVPAPYGSYLTGFFGDKNVAGLVYCTFGLLAVYFARRPMPQLLIGTVFAGTVWLTGSRTAIAAYLCALGWIVVAPKLPLAGRWLLGIFVVVLVQVTAEDYSQIGVFSDREGSDELRSRIDAASLGRVEDTGFFGQGLGEAYVVLDNGRWFFHNSYWSALVEGGWPWLLFVTGITVLVMLQPFRTSLPPEQVFAQGVGVAILICASRLGEVFLTIPWAVAMAFALRFLLETPSPRAEAGLGHARLTAVPLHDVRTDLGRVEPRG